MEPVIPNVGEDSEGLVGWYSKQIEVLFVRVVQFLLLSNLDRSANKEFLFDGQGVVWGNKKF